jgi:DNA-binding MarR family transcriptional regulator
MKPIAKQTGEESGFAIERFLPFRLSVLSNRLTRAVARVYTRRFRLSAPEWRTLAVLGRYGAMSANSVVDRTAMDKVRVSRAVARLTTAGHITRRTDPDDRRRAILDLTPQGTGIYQQIVPLVRAVENDIMQTLTADERRALDHAFTKLETRSATMPQADTAEY